MTTLLATRAPSLFEDGPGGEPTLDQLIASVWEGLTAHSAVTCPVCEHQMHPRYSATTQVIGGRCANCGTTLS